MTFVARWTCPGCGRRYDCLHYSDTKAPVVTCICGWRLPHDEAMRRIAANTERVRHEVVPKPRMTIARFLVRP